MKGWSSCFWDYGKLASLSKCRVVSHADLLELVYSWHFPDYKSENLFAAPIRCDLCQEEGPELFCTSCDTQGLPYHHRCWEKEQLHRPGRSQIHSKTLIRDLQRLRYINEPNKRTHIDKETFENDAANRFIEFNVKTQKFQFGPRASPLLRHSSDLRLPKYPSFVSFVGRTMNGKSFLLRSLLECGETVENNPTPIPAPGAKPNNRMSTSTDVNLYADLLTADSESPVHFLDCEGFEGSQMQSNSHVKSTKAQDIQEERRKRVEAAYPRIFYAFSTCLVFVTSGPLAETADTRRRLISYASEGASGSQSQGFKPSLFVVFNCFRDGNKPNFDWSIEASTKAFLDHEGSEKLKLFYGPIHVVYIPSLNTGEADRGLKQLDLFRECLHKEHQAAFHRRRDFRLTLTSENLTHFLWKALKLFSESQSAFFNWSLEAPPSHFTSKDLRGMLDDLWMQYTKKLAERTSGSLRGRYRITCGAFEGHVELCFRLWLIREPPVGTHIGAVPESLDDPITQVEDVLSDHAPCSAVSPKGIQCQETSLRHGDYHQSLLGIAGCETTRWPGKHTAHPTSHSFRKSLESTLRWCGSMKDPLFILQSSTFLQASEIRSSITCFGCLQRPPSTFLACGHALCLACIRNLGGDNANLHRLTCIWCPFHDSMQRFSPRLLPTQAGYRILSLDGGGVKGLAQLVMLAHIEKICFGIPTTQLYDLIVGTSVGGQIALALTAPTELTPLTVTEAIGKFKQLMKSSFVTKFYSFARVIGVLLDKSKYETSAVEAQLKGLFGTEAIVRAPTAPSSHNSPNVAVTIVKQETFKGHIVANYNRQGTEQAYPLLATDDAEEGMPIWAAARSTSAAFPFFDAFQWQGQTLLDGGFQLNCPARGAFHEAKSIWPEKQCDILVSLGTGKPAEVRKASKYQHLRIIQDIAEAICNTDDMWSDFTADPSYSLGKFRLNPIYSGFGFELDDFQKLDEIEKETTTWVENSATRPSIMIICDSLIAALFFFRPVGPLQHGTLAGEISCRLPVDLESRQSLINAMRRESSSNLFLAQCGNRPQVDIDVTDSLRAVRAGQELQIPVEFHNILHAGEVKIEIKMRSLQVNHSSPPRWSSISGSPYTLRDSSVSCAW